MHVYVSKELRENICHDELCNTLQEEGAHHFYLSLHCTGVCAKPKYAKETKIRWGNNQHRLKKALLPVQNPSRTNEKMTRTDREMQHSL